MKHFAPPSSFSLRSSSGSLASPMGKFGDIAAPKKSGLYTRMDALRNSKLQRRIKESKDSLMLFKARLAAKNAVEPMVRGGQVVTKVSRITAAHNKEGKGYHASGIGRIAGDLNQVKSVVQKHGYSHVRIGAVISPLQ